MTKYLPSFRENLDKEAEASAANKPTSSLPKAVPLANLEDELESAAKEIRARHDRDRKALLAELGNELQKYEIIQDEKELAEAYESVNMKYANKLVSVKSKRSVFNTYCSEIEIKFYRTAIQAAIPDAKDPANKNAKKKKRFSSGGRR